VARQAKVVVGAEHNDALAVDDGLGALVGVECLVEGVEAGRACRLGQLERARLGEDVAAVGVVVAADVEGVDVNGGVEAVVAVITVAVGDFVGQGPGIGSQLAFLYPVRVPAESRLGRRAPDNEYLLRTKYRRTVPPWPTTVYHAPL
jgi:hypothetical protein